MIRNIKIDSMKKKDAIHNLDTLERELYRLKLEARLKEVKLSDNWEQLLRDFPEIMTNSILCKKAEQNGKETPGQKVFNNERRTAFFDRIVEKFYDRITEMLDELFEKVFHKDR